MLENKSQLIVYIGKKPVKRDTVAGTATLWNGSGDVQEVPHGAAVKLLQHPDVWVSAEKFKSMNMKPKADKQLMSPVAPGLASAPSTDAQSTGENDSAKTNAIKGAILSLEQGNSDHFNERTGVPKVGPIREITGDTSISANEVTAVWEEMSKGAK